MMNKSAGCFAYSLCFCLLNLACQSTSHFNSSSGRICIGVPCFPRRHKKAGRVGRKNWYHRSENGKARIAKKRSRPDHSEMETGSRRRRHKRKKQKYTKNAFFLGKSGLPERRSQSILEDSMGRIAVVDSYHLHCGFRNCQHVAEH